MQMAILIGIYRDYASSIHCEIYNLQILLHHETFRSIAWLNSTG